MLRIDGIVPVIPTPFGQDEEIDWAALGGFIDFARGSGACAVCLPAYASEFYKLSEEERRRLVVEAVRLATGKIPVLAQVNYASAKQAAETARFFQQSGASAIAAAVPRQFAVPESGLLRYFGRILSAIDIPLLIQDFNPGGATVSAGFVATLHKAYPHFRWVKLEEAQMGPRVEAILETTSGEVGVLEGWGGMYMLELIPAGICGVMPGLAIADILARIYTLARAGQAEEAYRIFEGVLPQIVFSLQNLELFHHAEKRLLTARGLLRHPVVRDLRMELGEADSRQIDFLNARILEIARGLGSEK